MAVSFICFEDCASARTVTLQWDAQIADSFELHYKAGGPGDPADLSTYDGDQASEGLSPIKVELSEDENPNPSIVQYTLHGLDEHEDYCFVLTACNEAGVSEASREICSLGKTGASPYDEGWEITSGRFAGLKVLYNVPDSPELNTQDVIPALSDLQDFSNVQGVGLPVHLESPSAHFNPDVKVFIPCPGYPDVSKLNIYFYDENGSRWFLAHDAADSFDVIQPDAVGWLVENSRENRPNDVTPRIAMRVLHFSGVQAGFVVPSGAPSGEGGGGGGCFLLTINGRID